MSIKNSSLAPQTIRIIRSSPDGSLRSLRVTSPSMDSKSVKPSASWSKATCRWTKSTC